MKCHFFQEVGCTKKDCKLDHIQPEKFGICLISDCFICKKVLSFDGETKDYLQAQGLLPELKECLDKTFIDL